MKRISSSSVIDPLEFYSVSDSKLYDLLSWMVADANTLRRSKQLPPLESFSPDFKPMGVAASQRHSGSPYAERDWFLIHWPTVLKDVDTAFDLGCYSTVAVLWHFREVLFRRSVAFHDLLRRKISQHLTYRYFPLTDDEKVKRGYIDLSESEEEVFRGLAESVINTPKTLQALRRSFKETLVPRGLGQKLSEGLFPDKRLLGNMLEGLGSVPPNECSVFSNASLNKVWRQLPCQRIVRRVRSGGFGPSALSDDFRELFYAFHLRRVDHGVARLSPHVLAVNLRRYIPYRAPLTPYYKNLGGPKVYGNIEKLATMALQYFEAVFEPLIVHGAATLHRGRVETLWGDNDLDFVLFLSTEGITRRLTQANRMEVVRQAKSGKSNLPTGTKVPRLYIMSSPPLPELGVDEMRFDVIRRPTGMYWGVPWEIPSWAHYDVSDAATLQMDAPVEDLPRKDSMRNGVTYVEAHDRYYYSLEMLMSLKELPDNPVRKSKALRAWMANLTRMPAKQFQLLQAGVRKDLVAQQKRKPGRSLRGITWTKEEDDAICQYYRPGMTPNSEAKLLRICRGRSLRAILRRAANIREEMISRGIYDLNKLPHKNYNAKLRKLVQDAKDKAAAMVAEK